MNERKENFITRIKEFDPENAYQFNFKFFILIAFCLTITPLSILDVKKSVLTLFACSIPISVMFLLNKCKMPIWVKGLFSCLIPSFTVLGMFIVQEGTIMKQYLFIHVVLFVCLTFNKRVMKYYAIIMNCTYVPMIIVLKDKVLGSYLPHEVFGTILLYNVGLLMGYFLMILLGSLVERTKEKESQAINLVTELEETLNTVKLAGNKLDETTGVVTTNLYSIKEGVSTLAKTAEEITKANQYQSENVNEISLQVRDILGQVDKNDESIKTIQEQSLVVEDNISDGETKLDTLKVNVNNMESIMELSVENVGNLKTEIDNIDAITKGIRDIASKTNMLAINAQIESVKAGEFGVGFAVIASEVNKLAGQTSQMLKDVDVATKNIFNLLEETVSSVTSGKNIANESKIALNNIDTTFEVIKSSFEINKNEINESSKLVSKIKKSYEEVTTAIETIASISEENSASTQEIYATIEETASQISGLYDQSEELDSLSKTLLDRVK